jgi:hypothetical protein
MTRQAPAFRRRPMPVMANAGHGESRSRHRVATRATIACVQVLPPREVGTARSVGARAIAAIRCRSATAAWKRAFAAMKFPARPSGRGDASPAVGHRNVHCISVVGHGSLRPARASAAADPDGVGALQCLARQDQGLPDDDCAGDGHERDADQELDRQQWGIRVGPGGYVRHGARAGLRQGDERCCRQGRADHGLRVYGGEAAGPASLSGNGRPCAARPTQTMDRRDPRGGWLCPLRLLSLGAGNWIPPGSDRESSLPSIRDRACVAARPCASLEGAVVHHLLRFAFRAKPEGIGSRLFAARSPVSTGHAGPMPGHAVRWRGKGRRRSRPSFLR